MSNVIIIMIDSLSFSTHDLQENKFLSLTAWLLRSLTEVFRLHAFPLLW